MTETTTSTRAPPALDGRCPTLEDVLSPLKPVDDGSQSGENKGSSPSVSSSDTKRTFRKLMVTCIDSALQELGALEDVRDPRIVEGNEASSGRSPTSFDAPVATTSAPASEDNDPYGYGPASPEPAKACPQLQQVRGRSGRSRYQRRGSVTKFSLGDALKQVQKADSEGDLQEQSQNPVGRSIGSPLWHIYAKLDERPIKRTSLTFSRPASLAADTESPAVTKRRRTLV